VLTERMIVIRGERIAAMEAGYRQVENAVGWTFATTPAGQLIDLHAPRLRPHAGGLHRGLQPQSDRLCDARGGQRREDAHGGFTSVRDLGSAPA
jgi:hypothetical protein